jgi:hypothetical protein
MRATQAAKSLGAQQGTLGKAKEAELAAIKSPSGMTRDQIAERQFVIERASYEIQVRRAKLEDDIQRKQDEIYAKENDPERLKILKEIQDSEDEIYRLDNLRLLAVNAVYDVQAQIKTRNNEIATQQAALAKAEKDLQDVQDKREAALKLAELTHQKDIAGLKTELAAAEKAAKDAADALAAANKKLAEEVAALEAVEKAKAAAIAAATAKAAGELQTLEDSIADAAAAVTTLEGNLVLATTAATLLAGALSKVQTAKDNQNKKDLQDIIDKAEAEKKAAEDAKNAALAASKNKVTAAEDKVAAAQKAVDDAALAVEFGAERADAYGADAMFDYNLFVKAKEALEIAKKELITAKETYAKTIAEQTPVVTLPAPLTPAERAAKIAEWRKNNTWANSIPDAGILAQVGLSLGGMVPKYFAAGGFSKGTDTIPAMLTPGEFVIKKSAVDSYGVKNLSKINNGMSPDSSVYNYSLSVNVSGNNLNADDIASTVMQKIKYIDGQRVRGQR